MILEIKGERVIIRKTTERDLGDLQKLWNDGRVMKWVGFPDGLGYDRETFEAWLAEVEANPARHHFVIVAPEMGFFGRHTMQSTPATSAPAWTLN